MSITLKKTISDLTGEKHSIPGNEMVSKYGTTEAKISSKLHP